ncbi:MAG: hypothetical protein WBW04_13160 [Nitrolancea sp.]
MIPASDGYQTGWASALARFQHGLDSVLFVLFLILALILTPFGLLELVGGLFRGGEGKGFLVALGLANLFAAALFAGGMWLVRSNEPRLSAWRALAGVGAFIYVAGFFLPFFDRVWGLAHFDSRTSLFRIAWENVGLLLNGGLTIQELGFPIFICIFLLELRALVAHLHARPIGPDVMNRPEDR